MSVFGEHYLHDYWHLMDDRGTEPVLTDFVCVECNLPDGGRGSVMENNSP